MNEAGQTTWQYALILGAFIFVGVWSMRLQDAVNHATGLDYVPPPAHTPRSR